jgi:hypothetical protein
MAAPCGGVFPLLRLPDVALVPPVCRVDDVVQPGDAEHPQGPTLEEHPMTPKAVPTPTPRQEVDEAVRQLRAALDDLGIKLPSLGPDPLTSTSAELGGLYRSPLVELGRCRTDVALKLAEALRRAARAQ